MTREKKVEKIIEFFTQLVNDNKISDEELNQLYLGFKIIVETNKELNGDDDDE